MKSVQDYDTGEVVSGLHTFTQRGPEDAKTSSPKEETTTPSWYLVVRVSRIHIADPDCPASASTNYTALRVSLSL